jgi:cytochrome c553
MRPRRRWLAWAVLPLAVMGVGDPAVALADVPPGAQACLACHAPGLASTGAGAVPVPLLGGQQEEYLVKQLRNFRDGERGLAPWLRSGHDLAAGPLRALATYFAAQPPAPAPTKALDAPGRRLYLQGDAQRNVPACAGCHGTQPQDIAGPATPILHGQPAAYLAHQLRLWRGKQRDNSVDGLMNLVVERVGDADIDAVANFLAGAP